MSVEGWQTKRLEEIGVIYSGSTPSTSKPSFWDGNIVWVTPNDLSQLNTPYLYSSGKKITELGLKSCSAQILPPGSVVISSRAPIGYIAINRVECCTNQGCKSFKLKREYNPEFVYYNLHFNINKIKMLGEGTTFAEISKTALAKVEIPFLQNNEEQEKIAIILSTIDHAIEQTEAIIAKQQRIKTGLMQDLLTRGIDENGNVRREETHEFKDSAIGRIPMAWDVFPLDEVTDVLDPNPSHRNPIYVEHGYPFISTVEFIEPDSVEINTPRRVAEKTVLEQEKRCSFKAGSIAFSRKGTIGKTRILPSGIRFALLDSLCVINAKEGIDSHFINQMLRSHLLMRQIKSATMGVALPQISIGRVRGLLIPVPRQEKEQVEIARQISLLNTSVWEQRRKICAEKTGLMQDLLTSKVRVTPLLDRLST